MRIDANRLVASLAIASALFATACALRTVHVDDLVLSYAKPMAVQADLPLVIVLDEVPAEYRVERGPSRPMSVTAVDQFVSRDFAGLMSAYYTTVTVQAPGQAPHNEPHMLALVRVGGIGVEISSGFGGLISTLDWSVGLRPSGSDDFTFTYSNRASGTQRALTIFDTPSMLSSTFEAALMDFSRSYDSSGVHQSVREGTHGRP